MAVDFTAKISLNPDCKPSEPQYKIKCKQLAIAEEGSGNIREMMDDITEKIRDAVADEFRTVPRSVQLVGYSMSLQFQVIGPVNRSLAVFTSDYKATVKLSDGTEIDLDKLTKTADKVIEYAKRTGKTADQVLAEARAELAKQKAAEGKGAKP